MIKYTLMEQSEFSVIREDEPNQQYILREVFLGGLVLKLPVNNPDYHKKITDSEIEELTTIE